MSEPSERARAAARNGVCCACGYTDPDETPCPARDDGTHCVHWWDGPEEPDAD